MHVKVRVTASAKKESVAAEHADTLRIAVKEKTERNAANHRVIELVAAHFGVPCAAVRIIKGHTSPSKILLVETGE